MTRIAKAWINLLLFLLTLAINTFGAIGLINGMTQKEVSDKYLTLITPSPMIFSIWSVIYALVLISLIFMLVKHKEERTGKIIDIFSVPFWVTSVANILWIVSFSFEWMFVSTVLILVLVISLAVLNRRLPTPDGLGEKITALGFGLYNGWIIIATVVNIAATLVKWDWNGFGIAADTWAMIILIAALLITVLIQLKLRNAVLSLPVAWAYFGIWQEHQPGATFNWQYPGIAIVAIILMILFVLIAVGVFLWNKRCVLPKDRVLYVDTYKE